MAESQIEQTRISGTGADDPAVVELVRSALVKATALLDEIVPDADLEVTAPLRVGIELNPADAGAVDALAKLIVVRALEQAAAADGDDVPAVPSAVSAWAGHGVAAATFATSAPKAILLDPSFSGGVRGTLADKDGSYKRGRAIDRTTSTLPAIAKKVAFLTNQRKHRHGAKLTNNKEHGDFVEALLELSGKSPLALRFTSEEELPAVGPHTTDGALAGPVRFYPTLDEHGRLAGGRIGVDESLHQTELIRALGSQLDLLAGLMFEGHLAADALRREMRAEQMQGEGASSITTEMDIAAVIELDTLWRSGALKTAALKPKIKARRNIDNPTEMDYAIERAYEIRFKLAALGLLDDDANMANRIAHLEDHLEVGQLRQILSGLYFSKHPDSPLKSQKLCHLIQPEDGGDSKSWVGGGHQDGMLQTWLSDRPDLALVEAGKIDPSGMVLRRYAQFKWIGTGDPDPAGAPGYPAATPGKPGEVSFDDKKWKRSSDDKTTFENLMTFLPEVESAFERFLAGGGAPGGGGLWNGTSASGVPVMGFARRKWNKQAKMHVFDFSSVFPDGSKI